MPLVQERSSSSEDIAVVSPSQVVNASPLRLVGEPASTPSVSPRSLSSPLPMAKGEELGMEEASEEHEATADDEGSSPIGGEEPVPIE
ncbi:hypothetical protein AMTR_s00107p00120600 [Amborella trichopoda]|uniref:Uncharacterized protein n=1 Tax=Amborella trichopoda TaxID=13333 RepID=W1NYD8_AMBTC|nr:hypothetical protein AMTR_s00107p00120600 [Amborella trichopoda]